MSKWLRFGLPILVLVSAVGAHSAWAQVEVAVDFDRCFARPAESVGLNGSITNHGSSPVVADIELTLDVGGVTAGPIRARLPLAAGETRNAEISFDVPNLAPCSILSVTLSASTSTSSNSATAMLGILSTSTTSSDTTLFRLIGRHLIAAIGAQEVTATQERSFGNVKQIYR
jgi:hypothetical protein